ncbi:MAG TPA: GIDE domain-containing protein [candidate division Zixibacteria bacterium]|nr:GIDE domain-containing protein [candidate division Zixibacteria bacterium]
MGAENKDLWVAIIFAAVGAGIILLGFTTLRQYRIIKDTPRSKVRAIAMGLVEIHGKVAAYLEQFIKAPFSGVDCLFYKYEIEEYRKESGKNKSTYTWKSVGSGQKGARFLAVDETGEVLVDPTGVEAELSKSRRYYQSGKMFSGSLKSLINLIKALKDFDADKFDALADLDRSQLTQVSSQSHAWSAHPGDRRYIEYYIDPGDNLFLIGTAANESEAPNNIIIKKGKNEKIFILSDHEEKRIVKELLKKFWIAVIAGMIFFLVGVYMILKATNSL